MGGRARNIVEYSHDPLLVIASLAVALMAGFTGLTLTRGASGLPAGRRQVVVAMSAFALGGGIWSMHFVAMLGLELPILFYYDALTTMISALIAILIVGVALLLMHFGRRTRSRIVMAGVLVGLGIPAMHYTGMSGMELCRPVYSASGVAAAVGLSVALAVAAFWMAYVRRDTRSIVFGTLGFGVAVFAVHFTAMAGTQFTIVQQAGADGPRIGNDTLAFGVTLAAFLISGAFLMTGATVAAHEDGHPGANTPVPATGTDVSESVPATGEVRIPYEKDGRIHFVEARMVAAIRAEGHYTVVYFGAQRALSPWSMSETERRLPDTGMIRTHRSYFVNPVHVSGFERKKDTGVVFFEGGGAIAKAPVSRSRLSEVRALFGV
ncbi:MHYT domain-containing protein [Roseovarius ramblicola]|uniref:MHYT domain-containing protein n=1 Tax=Roseovarius ramblicola TaxID=2022336 RepID=A0ABV5I0Z0_9RHOB